MGNGGERPTTNPSWSRLAIRKPGSGIAIIAAIAVVWATAWAKDFLIPLALAFFLTCCLAPVVDTLQRLRVPRPLASAAVLGIAIACVCIGITSLRQDAGALLDQLPPTVKHVTATLNQSLNEQGSVLHRLKMAFGVPRTTDLLAVPAGDPPTVAAPGQMILLEGGRRVVALLANAAVIAFLIYFLLASGNWLPQQLADAGPAPSDRRRHREIFRDIESQMQRYVGVLALTNVALGLVTWLAFRWLDIPYAAVWGVTAGIVHVIPYVGPAVLAIASGLVVTVQFESFGWGLLVSAVTLLISTIIGMGMTTWLAGRASRMNTTAVFVSLLFWGWLWGLPGLFLGTPITMAIKVVSARVPQLTWVDGLLGEEPGVSVRRSWRILRRITA